MNLYSLTGIIAVLGVWAICYNEETPLKRICPLFGSLFLTLVYEFFKKYIRIVEQIVCYAAKAQLVLNVPVVLSQLWPT